MRRARIGRGLVALVSLGAATLMLAALALAADDRAATNRVAAATAAHHDIDKAASAGYVVQVVDTAGNACIAQPGLGAMGIHYLNPALLDAQLDETRPEVLVYEPADNGKLRLVAVEYLVFQAAWDAENADPPALFGQEFDVVTAPNRYGVPAFYALHAWIWKPNPSGLLTAWNPSVSCG